MSGWQIISNPISASICAIILFLSMIIALNFVFTTNLIVIGDLIVQLGLLMWLRSIWGSIVATSTLVILELLSI